MDGLRDKGFQCATLRLPKDYHDPAAGTLDVKIIRLPASDRDKRIGSLIINPGGPGGSGIELGARRAARSSRWPSASASTSWASIPAA